METSHVRKRMPASALFDPKIVMPAIGDSFRKLDPRTLVKNPVMFVLEMVTLLTTVILIRDVMTGAGNLLFEFQIVLWLWFTVLFANFSEAIAEGRGKAQADTLRQMRTETRAKRILMPDNHEVYEGVPAEDLEPGDLVLVEAGDIIPGDGEVIEGMASVNEAAITGESAPVIRESGGDRSAVTGGTTVISDRIVVRITSSKGTSFLDRMIRLVEGAERQKTPNEIALTILLVGLTIIFVFATATIPSLCRLCRRHRIGPDPGRAVRDADPDHDRRAAVGHRHRRHGPSGAVQCAGDLRTRRRSRGRRRHAAARQDRHHHARRPSGDRVQAAEGRDRAGTGRCRATRLARRRDAGRPFHRRAGEGEIRHSRPRHVAARCAIRSVHRAKPDERGRGTRTVDPQGRGRCGAELSQYDPATPQADSLTREARAISDEIAKSGGTPLAVARNGKLLGIVHLKDIVKGGIRERFAELRRMGIRTVMITGDNPMTAAAIAAEAGVDDFLAQATPEDKLRLIRDEQAKGRLVAMCGDGTNDAPALAQADVGVAMNTGTQAAREAGNMVDLDSNPTKLIEIVEIGKQLLMTRGALTTFSIANDVAKYFAIIPAMFVAFYPQLNALNIMGLSTPQSAILSAIIFNAIVIIALIPLALKGVKYRPIGAGPLLRRNLLIYGLGGIIIPFIGIKAIDLVVTAPAARLKEARSC